MVRLTVALLRKRAEHNEGCLADLKEIALHQQEIEQLEVVGEVCRQLEILYLSNNYIPRIEGLVHLKHLKYLNLAINNIRVIEGLEGCEMLEKLDLTLNFVRDLDSVQALQANAFLVTLHLTGNPCCDLPGYRRFVIHQLPQLVTLDGKDVKRAEQIEGRQELPDDQQVVEREAMRFREEERIKAEMVGRGVDPFPPRFNDKGERVYGHSAEERMQMLRETQREEEARKNPPKDPNSISAIHEELKKKPVRLTPAEEMEKHGRVLQRNDAKLPFRFEEAEEYTNLLVQPGKFISTSLITIDVQPTYVSVTVKDKVLVLTTPEEVAPGAVKVERAATTGELKIHMPLAPTVVDAKRSRRDRLRGHYVDD